MNSGDIFLVFGSQSLTASVVHADNQTNVFLNGKKVIIIKKLIICLFMFEIIKINKNQQSTHLNYLNFRSDQEVLIKVQLLQWQEELLKFQQKQIQLLRKGIVLLFHLIYLKCDLI